MRALQAFNLGAWIQKHRDDLHPPVCNVQVFDEGARRVITIREGDMPLLPPVFERFYSSETHRHCDRCATVTPKPDAA